MTEITRTLSDFAAGLRHESLPPEVSARARLLLLDLLGIALRARHDAESTPALIRAAGPLGLTGGSSTVLGDGAGYTPPGAALINGALAHSLDFDDTHAAGSIHPSAPIVPAALAAAEMTGAGGKDLIAAIVAGYEIQIRLSLALGPTDHYARGFHPTATCGVFGAAAAAGRIFGLDASGIANAFGIALSQAAGSMQFLVEGAWTKRSHVGQAAMNGLIAATLAREGFRGAVAPFEGKAGFFHAYAPDPVPEKAVAGLGETWETMEIAVKPYPSCRYSHAPIDALLRLRAANDISPEEIESVRIGVPRTGWNIVGDPEEAKQNPKSVVDGQFSMPFCAAVALRAGGLGWDDYANHLGDAETLALCKLVHTEVDEAAEAEFPANLAGGARITTARGVFEDFVAAPLGEPENFVSLEQLRAKFDGLAGPYLPPGRVDELATALLAIDDADDVGAVLRLSRPAGPVAALAG
jgi:2-methylcitrate dehydratase PrpD